MLVRFPATGANAVPLGNYRCDSCGSTTLSPASSSGRSVYARSEYGSLSSPTGASSAESKRSPAYQSQRPRLDVTFLGNFKKQIASASATTLSTPRKSSFLAGFDPLFDELPRHPDSGLASAHPHPSANDVDSTGSSSAGLDAVSQECTLTLLIHGCGHSSVWHTACPVHPEASKLVPYPYNLDAEPNLTNGIDQGIDSQSAPSLRTDALTQHLAPKRVLCDSQNSTCAPCFHRTGRAKQSPSTSEEVRGAQNWLERVKRRGRRGWQAVYAAESAVEEAQQEACVVLDMLRGMMPLDCEKNDRYDRMPNDVREVDVEGMEWGGWVVRPPDAGPVESTGEMAKGETGGDTEMMDVDC